MNTRQKGKELEDYIANELSIRGIDRSARKESKIHSSDISNSLGWNIEAKNTKSFNFYGTAKQVNRDARGYGKPAMVWHPPRMALDESVVMLRLADFMDILKFQKDHASMGEILDKWQIKGNLEKAVYHLKQVIRNL